MGQTENETNTSTVVRRTAQRTPGTEDQSPDFTIDEPAPEWIADVPIPFSVTDGKVAT